jgi:hypothetical protein
LIKRTSTNLKLPIVLGLLPDLKYYFKYKSQ